MDGTRQSLGNATSDADVLIDVLQAAYRTSSGGQPSSSPHVRIKWLQVAQYILAEKIRNMTVETLAVELHATFIGDGHRTEIVNRASDDPVLAGWQGVARLVIGMKPG